MTALLFDLDGCLVDSLPLIRACWQHTLPQFGLPAPSDELAREIAGPPVQEVARRLMPGAPPDQVAAALAVYRECCVREVGVVQPFDGVPGLLAALGGRGVTLAIATSRARDIAEPILARTGLREFFAVVSAPGAGELGIDKATVVGRALSQLADPVVIGHVGDRAHDVVGAHAHGLRAFGALWGYGGRAELEAAGADVLLALPADLVAFV